MSTSWRKRKARLNTLLGAGDDEDARSLALDRILHGQSVIGKTSKTTQIDELKFDDKDVSVVGTLEYGQYGVIDVLTCKLDGRVYVRKSVEKRFAIKTKDQCSPQLERDILLRALRSDTPWAPHLLCAYQSPTHLNLIMDYAEGGTLWDVMESSPYDGRVSEKDLLWWTPQAVSAIQWCHSQNFVHRDIKPHNFVINAEGRLLLIDFGSAAPLLTSASDGSQLVPKRYCLVPCGTCDYISPEILQSHEEALVALEMSDEPEPNLSYSDYEPGGYGRETDWWSFGAMLYEMAYGVAPFFADDIRQTYSKIMDHSHSLRFSQKTDVSSSLQDLLRRLLTTSELRLGRQSAEDVMSHPYFASVNWTTLHKRQKPEGLHLPQFIYSAPIEPQAASTTGSSSPEMSKSRAFSFSVLFQSSSASESVHPAVVVTPSQKTGRSILRETAVTSFIGFSWGPALDAFADAAKRKNTLPVENILRTPRPLKQTTPLINRTLPVPASSFMFQTTPQRPGVSFMTPMRPNLLTPFAGMQSTVRRTAQRRLVSDREAMKQLVDCVGMSARKRVLESGRKPRLLLASVPGTGSSKTTSTLKALRFDRSVMVVGGDSGVSYRLDSSSTTSGSIAVSGGSGSGGLWGSLEQDVMKEGDTASESSVAELSYSPTPMARPRSGSVQSLVGRSRTPSFSSILSLSRTGSGSIDAGAGILGNGSIARREATGSPAPLTASASGRRIQLVDGRGEVREERDVFTSTHEAREEVSYHALDALEKRHMRLLDDIKSISLRLSVLSSQFSPS